MVLLWMVAIDLLPSLADLLDDEEVGLGLDDPFDLRLFVTRYHDEAVTLLHDLLVSDRRDLDRLDARGAAALAVERQCPGSRMQLGACRDPFVHGGRSSSTIPTAVFVAFFAFLGTWIVARNGFPEHEKEE
jgi:hypothetical protein